MLTFNLFNTKINVSFSFSVCITLLALLDKTGLLFISFIAILLHELGHYAALKICRINNIEISLVLAAVKISLAEQIDNKKLVFVAITGPLANLIFSPLILFKNYYVCHFGAANIILFIFSMLPINNLDGGDILQCFLNALLRGKGQRLFAIISIATLLILTAFIGILFVIKFNNPTILIVGLYLIIMSYKKV